MFKPLQRLTDWIFHPNYKKQVYKFNEGSINDKILLGNKGANLCEMTRINLPIPPGFIITTEACNIYLNEKKNQYEIKKEEIIEELKTIEVDSHISKAFPQSLMNEYQHNIHLLENETNRTFGLDEDTISSNKNMPLLLSVRSGSAVSMPGMMDTILNLGINDIIVLEVIRITNNPRFAYDIHRRFLQMYGNVVLNVDKIIYENILKKYKDKKSITSDYDLDIEDLKKIIEEFKDIILIPDDPWEQLHMAIEGIFKSWNTKRAVSYRNIHHISHDLGTAVVVQSMVYGNMNHNSGSGVCFTRNPTNGENISYGEYLPMSEGEEVVSGSRTPMQLGQLQHELPSIYSKLNIIEKKLEVHYKDMQDIEFTVENGQLYILQTRTAKRTAIASVKIAVSMVKEKLITEREALKRIDASQMDYFIHPMIDPEIASTGVNGILKLCIGKGLATSAGAATGKTVFSSEKAKELMDLGQHSILIRQETSSDDIIGLHSCTGILTMKGGMTSHASVIARGMGKPAVTGASVSGLHINESTLMYGNEIVCKEGDIITIDGSSGNVYKGEIPTIPSGNDENYQILLRWADKYKRMKVFANAENITDIKKSKELGAEGIGLVRTEHMFFSKDRINIMRTILMSENSECRKLSLSKMLDLQINDFIEMFRVNISLDQTTIRLIDPPLHEFLPKQSSASFDLEIKELAVSLNMSERNVKERLKAQTEENPMLGFRGCRLSIVHPDITNMQVEAILRAGIAVKKEGYVVCPQIMIPLIAVETEVEFITNSINKVAEELFKKTNNSIEYKVGIMLEVPRACLITEKIAKNPNISFVSFGTNDLTQMTFGFSRDDTSQFLNVYKDKNILLSDPFKHIDVCGVGLLMHMAVNNIKKNESNIKIGVCGEHAADPRSILFFDQIGVDYISCSPYKIPIAKIAAAQAHIDYVHKFHEREKTILLGLLKDRPQIHP